jgi:uncharacterized membrane protein
VAELILLAMLFRTYVLNVEEKEISFLNVYLFVVFLIGLAYLLVFLPFISPDEPSHYLSAYRVSNLFLGRLGQLGDGRLMMRAEDYLFYDQGQIELGADYFKQTVKQMSFFAETSGYVYVDAPMVTNAIFGYLIPGLGIALARVLHLSGYMTFMLCRGANLLFFLLVLRYLMKKIPFGRSALFAITMMPMTIHMIASCSYDVSTFCFVALFVTQVMCMICSRVEITRKDYVLCIIYGILMAPSKIVYLPLLFLVLLIPGEKLAREKKTALRRKLLVIGSGIGVTAVILLAVNLFSTDSAIREMVAQNQNINMLSWIHEPGYTFSWLLGHVGEYLLMLVRTLIRQMDYYFYTLIGSNLGWVDVYVPQTYAVISFVLFLLAVNIRDEASSQVTVNLSKKLWILVLTMASVLCTLLVMTLNWTPMSYDYIVGVQGRYFTPLLISLIWLFRNRMLVVNSAIRKYLVFGETLLNLWILVYVFSHYTMQIAS